MGVEQVSQHNMITIEWKGKIGYGDIISPLCYAHNIAQMNCQDVTLHMRWVHKRGEKYKPEDPETIDERFKYLWSICKPVAYHKVHLKQTFYSSIDWNHTNYDDESPFHNLWWSRLRNQDNNLKYVVMNTTLGHKQSLEDYGGKSKVWKDPVGDDGYKRIERIIREQWGMDVYHVNYTNPVREVIDLYRKAFMAVGYHGSTLWAARYIGVPIIAFSQKKITKQAFPWALVKSKYDDADFLNIDPYEIRKKAKLRIRQLEQQHEFYINTPNLHRLRGERT